MAYFRIFHKGILIEETSIYLKYSTSSASKLVGKGLKKYFKIISILIHFLQRLNWSSQDSAFQQILSGHPLPERSEGEHAMIHVIVPDLAVYI